MDNSTTRSVRPHKRREVDNGFNYREHKKTLIVFIIILLLIILGLLYMMHENTNLSSMLDSPLKLDTLTIVLLSI